MSRQVALVLVALAVCGAVLGLSLGLRVARLDEGTVIAAYARDYARETGGKPTDCVARPGEGRVWLRIRCSGREERVILVSRWGRPLRNPAGDGI